jgi:guanine deaminase
MNKFMELAIKEAREGIELGDGGPFGAVVVRNGEVVGRGHNMVVACCDCTCHGEIEAIRDACQRLGTFNLKGCEIYTTSAPCPMCQGAIQWANIEKIYVGCNIQDAEDIGFRDKQFYENPPTVEEVNRGACLKLFEDYKNIKYKVDY